MAQKREKLLTVNEVAQMTGLSKSSLYAGLLGTNQLKRVRFQTTPTSRATIRFIEDDVLAWLEAKLNPPVIEPTTVPLTDRKRKQRITDSDRVVSLLQWKKRSVE